MQSKSILNILTSLKLTVVCLACAIILVFTGTLAQVNLGLWEVQARFFHSFLVWWPLGKTGFEIPVFPGGYAIGAVLLTNLVAAHLERFKLTWKKSGIFLVHFGLILLVLGQLTSELFQEESAMTIEEGETKNYSEAYRKYELAVVDKTDPVQDRVVAVADSYVAKHKTIILPNLPFTLNVIRYMPNSTVAPQPFEGSAPVQTTNGLTGRVFLREDPKTLNMERRNLPSAIVELISRDGRSLGTWFLSTWLSGTPSFDLGDKSYEISLRPTRRYKPFAMTLLDFRFDRYPGTGIPKNYSSEIRLQNPQTGEDRNILIYMNNPLRYEGETYYQADFNKETEKGTVLQVVRNPSWLMPYISCSFVTLGLIVQFLIHLVRFVGRRRQ